MRFPILLLTSILVSHSNGQEEDTPACFQDCDIFEFCGTTKLATVNCGLPWAIHATQVEVKIVLP